MPEGNGLGGLLTAESLQMHSFAETKTGDRHPQGRMRTERGLPHKLFRPLRRAG